MERQAQEERAWIEEVFELVDQYQRDNPAIAETMALLGLSIEQYQASLAALYGPRCITTSSTVWPNANLG